MAKAAAKPEGKEGFTLGLALLDAIPCIAFGIDMALLSRPLDSKLFLLGAFFALVGGLCMVAYKIILGIWNREFPVFKKMFPVFMGCGWLLMVIGAILCRRNIHPAGIWAAVCTMPATLFYVLGAAFFTAFIIYWKTRFDGSARSNWIEEILNGAAQLCMMIAVILSV